MIIYHLGHFEMLHVFIVDYYYLVLTYSLYVLLLLNVNTVMHDGLVGLRPPAGIELSTSFVSLRTTQEGRAPPG